MNIKNLSTYDFYQILANINVQQNLNCSSKTIIYNGSTILFTDFLEQFKQRNSTKNKNGLIDKLSTNAEYFNNQHVIDNIKIIKTLMN